jgi:hypothetical protein
VILGSSPPSGVITRAKKINFTVNITFAKVSLCLAN